MKALFNIKGLPSLKGIKYEDMSFKHKQAYLIACYKLKDKKEEFDEHYEFLRKLVVPTWQGNLINAVDCLSNVCKINYRQNMIAFDYTFKKNTNKGTMFTEVIWSENPIFLLYTEKLIQKIINRIIGDENFKNQYIKAALQIEAA